VIVPASGAVVTARFPPTVSSLLRFKMGGFIIHTFSERLQPYIDTQSIKDAAQIFTPYSLISDFSGYYISGPANPGYERNQSGFDDNGMRLASWDSKNVEFLPSIADDWRPWPWPHGIDPFFLFIDGSPTGRAFVRDDTQELIVAWAVGRWARRSEGLKTKVRPLVAPIVLLCCNAAPLCQAMADETGRMTWGPTGGFGLGAKVVESDPLPRQRRYPWSVRVSLSARSGGRSGPLGQP
jgi:hypothetical protein